MYPGLMRSCLLTNSRICLLMWTNGEYYYYLGKYLEKRSLETLLLSCMKEFLFYKVTLAIGWTFNSVSTIFVCHPLPIHALTNSPTHTPLFPQLFQNTPSTPQPSYAHSLPLFIPNLSIPNHFPTQPHTQTQTQFIWPVLSYNMQNKRSVFLSWDSTKTKSHPVATNGKNN